jgi:hypothetical protein
MGKKLSFFILVCTILFCTKCNCNKNVTSPENQLPPATQTGANTFGCLINGRPFVPAGSSLSGPDLAGTYQYIFPNTPNGYVFNIHGTNKQNTSNITSVGFEFDSVSISQGIYSLGLRVNGQGGGGVNFINDSFPFGNLFTTTQTIVGQLILTRFDLTNQIASGTFWFNAVNESSTDTIAITDGRFDVHFTE